MQRMPGTGAVALLLVGMGLTVAGCAGMAPGGVFELPSTAAPPAAAAGAAGNADQDGDGIADRADRCPMTPAGVRTNPYGCPMEQMTPAPESAATEEAPQAAAATPPRSFPRFATRRDEEEEEAEAEPPPPPAPVPESVPETPAATGVGLPGQPDWRTATFVHAPIPSPIRVDKPGTLRFAISFDLSHPQLRAALGLPAEPVPTAGGTPPPDSTGATDPGTVLEPVDVGEIKYIKAELACAKPLDCTPSLPRSAIQKVKLRGAMEWTWSLTAAEDRAADVDVTINFSGDARSDGPFETQIKQLPLQTFKVSVEHPEFAFLDWLKTGLDKLKGVLDSGYAVLGALGLIGAWFGWSGWKKKKPGDSAAG